MLPQTQCRVGVENMPYVLGRATVEDFDEWKSHFDAADSTRREHGEQSVLQSVDDPTEVVVLYEWDETEKARDLFDSEEIRERREAAGVTGRPDMTYLERVDRR